MLKFRFYCHVWTPQNGHTDKRYLMTGRDMQDARTRLWKQLEARYPGIQVHFRYYEQVTDEVTQPLYGRKADAVRDALRAC